MCRTRLIPAEAVTNVATDAWKGPVEEQQYRVNVTCAIPVGVRGG